MGGTNAQLPIGQQVSLPGHFDLPVTLESARLLAKGFECRVRLPDGTLDEAVTARLKGYLVKGFVLDDERLKNPPGLGVSALSHLLRSFAAISIPAMIWP